MLFSKVYYLFFMIEMDRKKLDKLMMVVLGHTKETLSKDWNSAEKTTKLIVNAKNSKKLPKIPQTHPKRSRSVPNEDSARFESTAQNTILKSELHSNLLLFNKLL